MTDELTNYDPVRNGRNTFLTVLCILTFIGSGWSLVSSSMGYFTADVQASAVAVAKEQAAKDIQKNAGNQKGAEIASQIMSNLTTVFTPDSIRKSSIASAVAALLCLVGAVLMWQLRKPGFYIYVAGTLVGIIAPVVLFGSNIFAMGMSALTGFFGILFVILYGVNLKSMK